ncbi:hypothetical protein AAGS40_07445 [Paraburkholderia sp. PREW-6R]|uniref:hypothetical protein n=1 Tax=Paraburkholderia sp. PREW-6R TaxID=3141544 RepID=UPI0031F5810B
MAHADLAVLGGVGMLALACLVVCSLYLYWSSERYRARQRQSVRQTGTKPSSGRQKSGAGQTAGKNNAVLSGVHVTMGTQLSHRCRTSLYRAVFSSAHSESIVFLIADSRENARHRASGALAAIHGISADKVWLSNLASFKELVDIGVSEDEELRVFELAWKDANVSAWVEHPLFLTDDPSLLGKWAELYADLARVLAVTAIDKARH